MCVFCDGGGPVPFDGRDQRNSREGLCHTTLAELKRQQLVPDDSWCILSIKCRFCRFDLAHFVFVLSHGLQVEVSSSLKLDTWSRAHLDQKIWKDQGARLQDRESVCRAPHGFSFQTQATEWEHDQEWLCHSAGGVWWKQICWDSKTWIAFEPWNTIMKSYPFVSRRPIPMYTWSTWQTTNDFNRHCLFNMHC